MTDFLPICNSSRVYKRQKITSILIVYSECGSYKKVQQKCQNYVEYRRYDVLNTKRTMQPIGQPLWNGHREPIKNIVPAV